MDSLMARQFQMADLWDNHVDGFYERVHSFEKKIGRILTPAEIHEKCRIRDHGEISDATIARVRPVLWAVYNERKREMAASLDKGEDWDEMTLIHWVDDDMRRRKISFSDKKTEGVFSRIKATIAEPPPY